MFLFSYKEIMKSSLFYTIISTYLKILKQKCKKTIYISDSWLQKFLFFTNVSISLLENEIKIEKMLIKIINLDIII